MGLPSWLSSKDSACQGRICRRHGFDPWVGKIPWRRKWQPTPVFLPGESHRRKSLVGYSPWVAKSWTRLSDFTSLSPIQRGFPGDSEGKEFTCNAGDWGSILGLGRSPGEGHDNPFQYSCLENPMGRGVWWVIVHGLHRVGLN